MSLRERIVPNEERLDQLAGLTGVGWTTSLLGYLGAAVGYGSSLVARPSSLLYLGGALFLATLGLDRLRSRHGSGSADEAERTEDDGSEREDERSVVVE